MDELELEVHGKKIKLLIHNRTWCEVYLLANDEIIALGGEDLDRIIPKLLIAFIIELLFLSNEGNVIPMFSLSIEDIKKWINKLTKFMITCMRNNEVSIQKTD